MRSNLGFTLIELLVVMAILSLLAVALLPAFYEPERKARMIADRASLMWHYSRLRDYRDKNGYFPNRSGHELVFSSWIEGKCERSQENRDRFFAARFNDPHVAELRNREVATLWRTYSDVSREDTHFRGVRKEFLRGNLFKHNSILIATAVDVYEDEVLALYGGGNIRRLEPDHPDLDKLEQ